MPKIKQFPLHYAGEWHTINIKFSVRSGKFEAVLPEAIAKVVGSKELYAKTLEELEASLEAAREKASSAATTNRQVIIFTFEYEGNRHDHVKRKMILGHSTSGGDLDGLQMTLWWHVAREQTYESKKTYFGRDAPEDKESAFDNHLGISNWEIRDETRVIDWTPEREAFFQALDDSMVQSILRMIDFMHAPAKKIAKAIDEGSHLLLGSGSKQKK